MSRPILIQSLHYLEKAKLYTAGLLEGKGRGALEKPSKLLLDNPNLFDSLSSNLVNEVSRRKCFFVNQLRNTGHQDYPAKAGDFVVNQQYISIVGGIKENLPKSKTFCLLRLYKR